MRRWTWWLLALVVLLPAQAAAATRDWPTWGDSLSRQGDASSSLVRVSNAGHLQHAWTRHLGAYTDTEPLYITGLRAHGAHRSAYIVATETGFVSAFDARTGAPLWRRNVGNTKTTCVQVPGGTFGVTGAPTYDEQRRVLYVSSQNLVFALDIDTGRVVPGWPIALVYNPIVEHVWGALALNGRYLYLATASFCDRQPYKGRVFRVDVTTRAVIEWDAVPTPGDNGGGGIWGWGGLSIDKATGNVWAATGNSIGPDVKGDGDYDAESVVELSSSLQRLHASKPPGVPRRGDYDFGATPLLFAPPGCHPLVAALNKNGTFYLWRRDRLDSGPYQSIQLAFPATLFGSPTWDSRTRTLYMTTTQGYHGYRSGLQALRIGTDCRASLRWNQPLGSLLDSMPTIVNDTIVLGTGTGHLEVFVATTGKKIGDFRLGDHPAFVAPIAVGGDIAIASWNKQLDVFRLPGS